MKKVLITLSLCCLSALSLWADGGMWLMSQMKSQEKNMKARGLEMDAIDVYNPNGASLKDAVIMFDGGCTGVIVSDQGLILTNHHCGYDQVQAHSTVKNNYLEDGFWAQQMRDELVNPGLEVEMVDQIDDVTDIVVKLLKKQKIYGTMEALSPRVLSTLVPKIVGSKAAKKAGRKYVLKAFYGGNKYLLFTNKVYSDVRLVGAPPSSIGKFGSDTDNWMWPRHSGDFTVFRIYVDENNEPAPYSPNNRPLQPKRYAKIATKGIERGDYAMIMGFPGTTFHFYTAPEVEVWGSLDNNIRIEMRAIRQEVMLRSMLSDTQTNIMYAAKYAYSQNGYKRAQGANWAIKQRNLKEIKLKQQQAVVDWAKKQNRGEVVKAVSDIEKLIHDKYDLHRQRVYLTEGVIIPVEMLKAPIIKAEALAKWNDKKTRNTEIERLQKEYARFYDKDYSVTLDREITQAVLARYTERIAKTDWPQALAEGVDKYGSVKAYVNYLFDNSIFTSPERFARAIEKQDAQVFAQDPITRFSASVIEKSVYLNDQLRPYDAPIANAQKTYIRGILDMQGEENVWPDANLTLRFTFGNVMGYQPKDNVFYGHQTTLKGVMEKEDPNNWEYVVSDKLKALYQARDYGRYALENGEMPVNFCLGTHTTGGNSGSPVFNSKGELLGLNFDRNWEGVGGDIEYLADYQRSIIVDIRYILFVIDKYAGCQRLIDEMKL